jgi:hypothetical protein
MIDERDLLEEALRRFEPEPGLTDRIYRRRDRKRRNQRISAGLVGIAVFVAAVWIVTSGLWFDRSETSVVPGGDVTGPAETGPMETGPTETGPTVTGPVIRNTGDPSSVGFGGLPPEGATPSKPLRGEIVMEDSGSGGPGSWYAVIVYADGRLIWSRQVGAGGIVPRWIEQRLTPEGVELLRSGAVPLGGEFENPAQGLPATAWEDRTLRPFVPWKYHACLTGDPPSLALDFLPAEAKDILRRSPLTNATAWSPCREVTLEDARVLVEILSEAGFELFGDQREELPTDGGVGATWMFPDGKPPNWERPRGIQFWIVLPHGSSAYPVGW